MRLIHTPTLQLKEWITEAPHYVILSHTWGPEEVTFDDFSQPHAQSMLGYEKIRRCCEQAIRDGFEWAWVDTCCIDKRSSAELSEAINSMWKWYWNASICYAWLNDVSANARSDPELLLQSFQNSKWFTRGWTLQELLAPAVVEFYDETWTILGTKSSLLSIISTVTWIDEVALSERQKIRKASVAQRLSWAATRLTSREEDRAYCLLGLLDLNMPLLYGEGKRAFYRLQLELLKTSEDQTLFAWELPTASIEDMGLLAPSPLAFQFSGKIRAGQQDWPGSSVTNRGLVIQLPCLPHPDAAHTNDGVLAVLNCYFDGSPNRQGRVGIFLARIGAGQHWRVEPTSLQAVDGVDAKKAVLKELCIGTVMSHLEHSLPTSWNVSVTTLPSFDSRFTVQRLAKYCPQAKNGRFEIGPALELQPSPIFVFDPDDYAAILLQDDGARSFLVTFGQRGYSMIWIHVQTGVLREQFDMASLQARYETIVDPDHHRDAVDADLVDGTKISVRAKKMRQDGLVGWQILIDAAAPVMDSDTTMLDQEAAPES
jgi:hypothetical protein